VLLRTANARNCEERTFEGRGGLIGVRLTPLEYKEERRRTHSRGTIRRTTTTTINLDKPTKDTSSSDCVDSSLNFTSARSNASNIHNASHWNLDGEREREDHSH
jgi:hypothetical protein